MMKIKNVEKFNRFNLLRTDDGDDDEVILDIDAAEEVNEVVEITVDSGRRKAFGR